MMNSVYADGERMNQKTTSVSCDNQPINADISGLANILEALTRIPFELTVLLLAGKKTPPFLAELTGISASRLRRGNSSEFRESTVQSATTFAAAWSHKMATDQGWSNEEINLLVQTAPSSIAGEARPFADFIHGLQLPGSYELPLATAFAEKVDLMIFRLLDAHRGDDLEGCKQAILECDWLEAVASQQNSGQQMEALRVASDWQAVLPAIQPFLFDMLLCLFAALDAEFGLVYFSYFQPRPIFLFVMPKLNAKVDLGSLDNIPKRNFIYRPVRRLLELTHALMVLKRDQCWPEKPVGRKLLGEALDLMDQEIGNFFDGTRNMNAKLFEDYWVKLHQTVANGEPCASPLPLLLTTLVWQSWITRHPGQKLKSLILPDKESYTRFWKWHHQRWASKLDKGTTVGWPAWLDD